MKISILLLMIGTIQMMASPGYSQRAELSLEMENVAVKDVLEEIESNSEFFFLYSSKMVDLERKVSVQASEDKIDQVLAELFRGENIKPYIIDRQIILSPDNLEKEEVTAKIKQQQQQHEVSGTVTDAQSGEPLPGV
ncbi:MAG: STN domain-containing protein, partial [Bacteroidota bacterium]